MPVRRLEPNDGGPKATLRYSAGGVGHPNLPGSTDWNVALGRYWSHDYAERIVEDVDETHVWLLTRTGVFREFSNLAGGTYQTVSPSDEYRTLSFLGAGLGWELRSDDGMVESFDDEGKWLQTAPRNGNATNATTASYDPVTGQLVEVEFPDGRSETFAYDAPAGTPGKLLTITEVGVTGVDSETWTYGWTGNDLTRIDRPDGTAWVFEYADPNFPGYIAKMLLEGTDASQRVERAWEYDTSGNIFRTWKGADNFTDPESVEQYEFAYDDPGDPTQTAVTDPLGEPTTYSFDRDPVSDKVRLQTVTSGCPLCGLFANRTFEYTDAANLLRPTAVIDELDNRTEFTYDVNGQVLTKTEAANDPSNRRSRAPRASSTASRTSRPFRL